MNQVAERVGLAIEAVGRPQVRRDKGLAGPQWEVVFCRSDTEVSEETVQVLSRHETAELAIRFATEWFRRQRGLIAIAVLREPSEAMIDAGAKCFPHWGRAPAGAAWRAMIEAALAEPRS